MTLGDYKKLSTVLFGPDSSATKFLEDKIEKDPDGENAEVIAAESQMMYLLVTLHQGESK